VRLILLFADFGHYKTKPLKRYIHFTSFHHQRIEAFLKHPLALLEHTRPDFSTNCLDEQSLLKWKKILFNHPA
jgi:hypothetical protein